MAAAKDLKSEKILPGKWWFFDLISVAFHIMVALVIAFPLCIIHAYWLFNRAPYSIADYMEVFH